MRLIATLIIVILAALPVLYAGWPGQSPAFFARLWNGVPGSIAVMSVLMAVFVLIAGIAGAIARNARSAGQEGGR